MMPVSASAPGKIILLGEHAVVYGQPALAVPVDALQATAHIEPAPPGSGLVIDASDVGLRLSLAEAAVEALSLTARLVLDHLQAPEPDALISLTSSIPVASGLGSGAAVSAALARALGQFLGEPFDDATLSGLVFEVEKLHHGTPSGIDNTVICYGQPVYFVRGHPPETLRVPAPLHLVVGDTGHPSPTRETVGAVRQAWQRDPATYDALFARVGALVTAAREAIEEGLHGTLGALMTQNQALLRQMGVSSPELEALIEAALAAGALGAKLSGGGGGGNMIALTHPGETAALAAALRAAGAAQVVETVVS